MKCCINNVNFIRLLLLSEELFKFGIQKYGQILCVHKPYFLMPGHIYIYIYIYTVLSVTKDTTSDGHCIKYSENCSLR